jgi:hypothetical protein
LRRSAGAADFFARRKFGWEVGKKSNAPAKAEEPAASNQYLGGMMGKVTSGF